MLVLGTAIEAAPDVPQSAFAVADALQAVETSRLAIEARTQAGIEKGRNSPEELKCWKAADFTPVRAVYAEAIARVMSSAEMEEAAAFLGTPLGSKFVHYMNAQAMQARGWSSPAAPSLTEEESAAALKFLSTSAGSKLYGEELQSPELQKRMLDVLLPMLQKCMEPKSVARRFEDLEGSMTTEERERAAASARDTRRPTQAEAIKLVRAMREDELLLANLRYQMKTDTRSVPKAQLTCIEGLKPGDISGTMAIAVQEQLSASEVKDAMGFYESDVGRKFVDIGFANIERPLELEEYFKLMTIEEVQSMRQFFVLFASRKLMGDNIIQAPASMKRLTQRVRELTESCVRGGGANR